MLFGESFRFDSTRVRRLGGIFLLALLGAGVLYWGAHGRTDPQRGLEPGTPARTRPVVPADQSRVTANFGNLPLSFEPNRGQTDPQVKFLSRNPRYNLFLTSTEAVFALPVHSSKQPEARGRVARIRNAHAKTEAVLKMTILGTKSTPAIEGAGQIEGHTNYFTGRNPNAWVRDVPQYARVQYHEIYPGVDLTFYGQQGQLEFDFIVKPGADPAAIALGISGATKIRTNDMGDLVLTSAAGDLRLHKPVAYQGESRSPVDVHFVVNGTEVALALGAYDHSRELVIDPSIAYSTYLGGGNQDDGFGIAVDNQNPANIYVTGQTLSSAFPKKTGSQTTFLGHQDAFITKLKADGTGLTDLLYTTFLGGAVDGTGASAVTGGNAIAIDNSTGNAYVVGSTNAADFPIAGNSAQVSLGGGQDAFVAVLNPAGSSLVYSTYLGGSNDEIGFAVALDSSRNIYAVGETKSTDFPTQSAIQGSNHSTAANGADGFVTKLKAVPDGSFAYSDYLGGTGEDDATGVAVDSASRIYVSGITFSTDFPTTAGAFQLCGPCNGTIQHAFVTAIPATFVPTYIYSTYLRGSKADEANLIAVDSLFNAYVVGQTASTDFPTTSGAFQTALGSGATGNAFITKLNPTGTAAVYSTYLGGGGADDGLAIALDSARNAYVTGTTTSTNFPTSSPTQSQAGGASDAFVTELNAAGSGLVFSTYLGGKNDEDSTKIAGIALDAQPTPNIYVTGGTHSTDFPFTAGAFQTANASGGDAFVAKFSPTTLASQFTIAIGAVSPSTISRGSTGTATVTVTSTGFVGDVPLSCSIAPTTNAPTCSVTTPVNLATNGGTGTATLTITTAKAAAITAPGAALWLPLPGLALAGAGILSIPRRKKKMIGVVLGTLAFAGLLLMMACGSGTGGGGGGGGGGGTTPGSYTVTVQGGVNGTPGTATFTVQ